MRQWAVLGCLKESGKIVYRELELGEESKRAKGHDLE